MDDSNPIVTFRQVTKRFGGITALDGVSLDIRRGSLHAVVGENGAGKSTLMKILSGVITEYDGQVFLRGEPVTFRTTRDAEAAGIGIIHQELNLVDQLSAAANIFLGRETCSRLGWLNQRSMDHAAGNLLRQLECDIPPIRKVGQLRVGDQQLVEIAKSLSLEASILIMDEPTSALTETEVERLFRVIAKLRADGATILYISHKMKEVFRLADTITVLRDGKVVTTVHREETDPASITRQMVGREIASVHSETARAAGETILEVRNLSLPWPGHAREWRLRNVSFSLRRGEAVGIAGLMGAGRTELLESLFGATTEQPQGEIMLEGNPTAFHHPIDACRAGLALVTEDRKRLGLFPHFSVAQNVSLSSLREAVRAGIVVQRKERSAVSDIVSRLSIRTAGIDAPIMSLSGGNQQKAVIGRWLLTKPKVLLLDDPTRGVDVGAKAELYRLMDELCRAGLGILVTSSELPELLAVCDRILVLCEGELTAAFDRQDATEEKIMAAATGHAC